MKDQELLELAAKAAGYWWRAVSADGQPMLNHNPKDTGKNRIVCPHPWNPLEDDGDALRLAVKLQMQIAIFEAECHTRCPNRAQQDWFGEAGDPYAATRRAIVGAAAEIGKGME